jgi:hypothetical protein
MRENLSAFPRRNKSEFIRIQFQIRIKKQKKNKKKNSLCKRFLNNRQKLAIHPREANQLIIIRHTSRVLTIRINTQRVRQPRIPFRNLTVDVAFGWRMSRA